MSKTQKLKLAIDKKQNISLENNKYYVIVRNKIYEEYGESEELKQTYFYGKLQIKETKIKILNPVNINWQNTSLLDFTEKMEKKRYNNDVIENKMMDLKIKTENGFESIDEAKMKNLFNGEIIINNELCFFGYNKMTDYDFYIIEENKSPTKTFNNPEPLIENNYLDQKMFEDNARFLELIKEKTKIVNTNLNKMREEKANLEKEFKKHVEIKKSSDEKIELLKIINRDADLNTHSVLLKQEQIKNGIQILKGEKKTIQGLVSTKQETFVKDLDPNKLPDIKKTSQKKISLFKKGGKRKTRKQRKY